MKIKILLFTYLFFALSCTNNENINEPENELASFEIQVDDIENLKTQSGQINAQLEKFKIGKNINSKINHSYSHDTILNKDFINVFGFDKDGNSIAYRQEITIKSLNENTIIVFNRDGLGETCTGVNCSHCKVKEGGGCTCESAGNPDQTSYCNHTVSTGDDK